MGSGTYCLLCQAIFDESRSAGGELDKPPMPRYLKSIAMVIEKGLDRTKRCEGKDMTTHCDPVQYLLVVMQMII